MEKPKTIYDLGYFDSKKEAQRALERFSESTPLTLPEHGLLTEIADELTTKAKHEGITAKDLLLAYQRLRENHDHTDVFCAWKDSGGNKCGGFMDIEVDAAGAFYLCQVNNKHRTPK
jgi:hypothetical protein